MAIGSPAHALATDGFTDIRENTSFDAGRVQIHVARHSGYCWGVQRAYHMTLDQVKTSGGAVATWGPLIHNPQTIKELEDKHGVKALGGVEEADGGTVVVRTHGAPVAIQNELKERGIKVVDATCPYVSVSQRYAKLLYDEKYHVVIAGNPSHPEILSVNSFCNYEATVVYSPEDVKNVPKGKRRIGVVVQTTMILENVNEIIAELNKIAQEVRVFNTICYVTDERQSDAETIARGNDHVVVIGGNASSNTKKLAVVAEKHGARTQLVEGPADVNFEFLKNAKNIGILAGASTPNWLIDQVVEKIANYFQEASA